MPISEDEFERQRPNQSTMSKAEQRRNNKPIMEKRRRARINHCLNELKTLILDAMKKDPARHSKLEKADILEMTVKHLQTLQRQQLAVAVATDPSVLHKFKTGFNECAGEVTRYIGNMDGVETGVKQRLVAHLSTCVSGLQQTSPFPFSGVNSISNGTSSISVNIATDPNGGNTSSSGIPSGSFNGDVNNNQNASRIQVPPGIQLIPSRLPTGELALLVPNGSNLPFFSSSIIGGSNVGNISSSEINSQRSSNSAFTTVRPSKHPDSLKISSPPLSPASSTTSFDDHHQVSESFHRPRTPSPKEVTISFPTPPGSFHHSSAFKPSSTITQEQSPPQQFQITSTSYSPENKEYGLKIEYKAVPIYQPSEKTNFKHFANKSLEPISVITSDKSKITNKENYHQNSFEVDNRNSRISRKRSYPLEPSEGLLVVAKQDSQPSTSKYTRYSMDAVSTTTSSSSSASGSPDQQFSVENRFHQPSTSGYGSNQHGDSNNDHMWRPW